jgi:reactive intermediate/imine deaminase
MKQSIHTDSAPAAIGPYSQAIRSGNTIYFSGQIPLDPLTMTLVSDDFGKQARQVMLNLQAVSKAAGGDVNAIVKLTIYLTSLTNFAVLNEVMQEFFTPPYPARTTIEISALPKAALVEIDAVMML